MDNLRMFDLEAKRIQMQNKDDKMNTSVQNQGPVMSDDIIYLLKDISESARRGIVPNKDLDYLYSQIDESGNMELYNTYMNFFGWMHGGRSDLGDTEKISTSASRMISSVRSIGRTSGGLLENKKDDEDDDDDEDEEEVEYVTGKGKKKKDKKMENVMTRFLEVAGVQSAVSASGVQNQQNSINDVWNYIESDAYTRGWSETFIYNSLMLKHDTTDTEIEIVGSDDSYRVYVDNDEFLYNAPITKVIEILPRLLLEYS